MRGTMRSRFIAASFVLTLFTLAVPSTYAQLGRFAAPATTLAPAVGVPADLKLDVLALIPNDALGFVTVHHVRDLKKTVENVLRKLNVPYEAGGEYAKIEDLLDSFKGWDDQGMHAAAFFAVEGEDEPDVVMFVPVKNYKEFATSMGAEETGDGVVKFTRPGAGGLVGWMALKGDYAVMVDASGKDRLGAVLASNDSLAPSCEPIRKWLGEQQAAAVATSYGVQHTVDQILEELKDAEEDLPDDPVGKKLAPVFLKLVKNGLELARNELTHVAFSSNIDETKGVRFQMRAVYPAGKKVAAFVKGIPPLPADSLKHLSGEDYFAVQSYTNLESLIEPSFEFVQEMLTLVAKDEKLPFDVAEWQEILKDAAGMWKGVAYTSTVTGFVAGGGIYDGMCGIVKVDDAKAYMARYEPLMKKVWAALRKLNDKLPELPLTTRKIDDREVSVFSFNVIELMSLLAPNDPALKQQQAMMKQMVGNDGKIEVLIAAVGDKHLVYALNEELFATVANNIRDGKAGLADNVLIQQTASLLPRDLGMVGYLDIGGYVEMIKAVMQQAMAGQGNAGFVLPIPPFPNAPPVGMSLKADATAMEADFVVPMDLMTAVRDYVTQIMAVFGNGGLN